MIEFQEFPKIPRLNRDCVISEKIDGTNGQIIIEGDQIAAASRSRIITPDMDNFGFAKWDLIDGDDAPFYGWVFDDDYLNLGVCDGCLGFNEDYQDACMPTHWFPALPISECA